eukprot:4027290-Prymnesium_polylepis.1
MPDLPLDAVFERLSPCAILNEPDIADARARHTLKAHTQAPRNALSVVTEHARKLADQQPCLILANSK